MGEQAREIKFNFYNTKTKKYTRWEESNAGMSMCSFYTHEHLKFLQYTGLKDKNGVEIYEGDILRASAYRFLEFNVVVQFGEYKQDGSGGEYSPRSCIGFYGEAINPNQEDEDGFRFISDYYHTTSLLEFGEVEVIGNIFTNPELLEVK